MPGRPMNRTRLSPLGVRLMALIDRRGYPSLRAAALDCGLEYTQLHKLVIGRHAPEVATLERVVAALGGTMAELYAEPAPQK